MVLRLMKAALFCFAVPLEARPFLRRVRRRCSNNVLITGIGRANASKALRQRLLIEKPDRVISCGFAGALDPDLEVGDVVFDAAQAEDLDRALAAAGAHRARFYCVDTILCKASGKRRLRVSTGADAVDMESASLSEVCREANLEFAIVRAVSDCADEDLPLDFNKFITPDQTIDLLRLVLWSASRPAVLMKMLNWYRNLSDAANRLAHVLISACLLGHT